MMKDVHDALKLPDGSDDPAIFYEPFNEPNGVTWAQGTTAMQATLTQFRQTLGYQGLLVLDTTTWSHDYSDSPMTQIEAFDATLTASGELNLAFARHDYCNDYGTAGCALTEARSPAHERAGPRTRRAVGRRRRDEAGPCDMRYVRRVEEGTRPASRSRYSRAPISEAPSEVDESFRDLIDRRATEGCDMVEGGVRFHRASRPCTFRKTHAPGPSLTVVAQGRKVARFGADALPFGPEACLLITGECSFEAELLQATHDRPYLAASIDIPVDLVVKTLLALPELEQQGEPSARAAGAPPAFTTHFDDPMRRTVTRLFGAFEDPLERRIVAPLILEELTFRLLRSDAAHGMRSVVGMRDARVIHRAMRYMRSQAQRALSVNEIAHHVGMSPSHFAHRFRAVAGVSPIRYLKNIRLDEARAAVLAGDLRVGEVAARVGYESASHFTRDFKAAFGLAPVAYGRRMRAR